MLFSSAKLQATSVLSTGTLCIHYFANKRNTLDIYQEQVREQRGRKEENVK